MTHDAAPMEASHVIRERLLRLMAAPAAVQPYGFALESFAEDWCTIRIPWSSAVQGPCGLLAGPVFMAAADFTMWLALLTKDPAAERAVTVDLTTHFLSSARAQDVLCTATLLKWGRRLVVGTANCTTIDGRLLSHHTVTYAVPTGGRSSIEPVVGRR